MYGKLALEKEEGKEVHVYSQGGYFIRSRRGLSCTSCPGRCSRGGGRGSGRATAMSTTQVQHVQIIRTQGTYMSQTSDNQLVDSYTEYNCSWLSNSLYLPSVAWWGRPHARVGHLPADYVKRNACLKYLTIGTFLVQVTSTS